MVLNICIVQSCKLEAPGLHSAFKYVLFGLFNVGQVMFMKFLMITRFKITDGWLFLKLLLLFPGHTT